MQPTTGKQALENLRVIPSDLSAAHAIQAEIEQVLKKQPIFDEREVFAIKLAVEEALVNAIKHGNQMDPDKKVTVRYELTADEFQIRITDQGTGYDPEDVPDPTLPENLERPCGRGLMLIRHYMSHVEIQDGGNTISMYKRPKTK